MNNPVAGRIGRRPLRCGKAVFPSQGLERNLVVMLDDLLFSDPVKCGHGCVVWLPLRFALGVTIQYFALIFKEIVIHSFQRSAAKTVCPTWLDILLCAFIPFAYMLLKSVFIAILTYCRFSFSSEHYHSGLAALRTIHVVYVCIRLEPAALR